MDAAIRRGHPIVFGSIIVFSIIEMSISAWLTSQYTSLSPAPSGALRSRVHYILFLSVWTILFCGAFLGVFLVRKGSVLVSVAAHFVFLALTWILWLAAAAAITQTIGGALNCSTQTVFVFCGQLNALEGFAWLIWVMITFSLVLVLVRGIQSAKRGDGYGAGLVDA
ncbi:unnamed protein product [Cyclocybe aegerita]|uniref:MARVEL domain-containing protein n=1 Tax=Cyclocybe aegerita TaxID=1973307 RepID=A0A8S0XNQ0_CYCAE|nr:unnamed protein product [Cyclocybe aegerita]